MQKDTIYQTEREEITPFEFNQDVVDVFDDMINRSVPFYKTIIQHQIQLIRLFYQPDTYIYDLGCSNGNLEMGLGPIMPNRFKLLAIDSSPPMLAALKQKLPAGPPPQGIVPVCQDILDVRFKNASIVVLNFTLQFLPLEQREALLQRIYEGLLPGGLFLFSEKIVHQDPSFAELQKHFYYNFKRQNGYSELEISQKREALEDILIPETIETHQLRLTRLGFEKIEIWLKWFNFVSIVGQK